MAPAAAPLPEPARSAPPVPPSPAHLEAVQARTAALAETARYPASEHAGAPDDVVAAVEAAVDALAGDLVALSRDLHANPEEGFAEHRSAAAVADLLARHGAGAEVGVHGLETALRARSGDGAPVVAVLAEYDALPGIGHGCGHNVIAATAVGAFLALDAVRRDRGLPGSVVLLGTPAEEGGGGKVLMAQDGAFDGVDAAVMLHPFSHDVADHPFLGRRQLDITYLGVAAHASAQPFMGRNALDAVMACYSAVAMLRQHLPGTDRVHGVVTDGGQRPNVVPERAAVQFYLRSADPATLDDLAERVEAIAVAAAA